MGCCFTFLRSGGSSSSQTEMTTSKDADAPKGADRVLTIARNMSSPSVKIDDMVLLGTGLALVGVSVEQDAAYWVRNERNIVF